MHEIYPYTLVIFLVLSNDSASMMSLPFLGLYEIRFANEKLLLLSLYNNLMSNQTNLL